LRIVILRNPKKFVKIRQVHFFKLSFGRNIEARFVMKMQVTQWLLALVFLASGVEVRAHAVDAQSYTPTVRANQKFAPIARKFRDELHRQIRLPPMQHSVAPVVPPATPPSFMGDRVDWSNETDSRSQDPVFGFMSIQS
jgi:hypothetical protein